MKNRPSGLTYIKHKENPTSFKQGMIPWNKGKRGEFKGKSYDGLHDWVERNLGKARDGVCSNCEGSRNLQWANISNEYKPDLSDWKILCKKCHAKYDYEQVGARRVFYT